MYRLFILKSLFTILIFLNFNLTKSEEFLHNEAFNSLINEYLGENANFSLNNKIKIIMLDEVEEAHEVSMIVKIPENLYNSKKITFLVDNNPIQLVAEVFPNQPVASLGMNIRMEQDSYVRAAILDQNDHWNIASKKVVVKSPGGCSLPVCNPEKEICEERELGKIFMQTYKRKSGAHRLKFMINHPMDTGLVLSPTDGKLIPEYYMNNIHFKNNEKTIAVAQTYGAMSANPTIVIDFKKTIEDIAVEATDTKGKLFISRKK